MRGRQSYGPAQSLDQRTPRLRWLVADLNSYFASCEQQENPDLRGKPIAVAPLLSNTTCAIAASYEAKAYGVKTGTNIGEARKMCPGLIVVPSRPKLYVEYHHRILDAIESCIPIEHVMSIDEVACVLDRSQQTAEAVSELSGEIKQAIRSQSGRMPHPLGWSSKQQAVGQACIRHAETRRVDDP